MKKRILAGLTLILVLLSGGFFVYHKLTKPDFSSKINSISMDFVY